MYSLQFSYKENNKTIKETRLVLKKPLEMYIISF